MRGLRILLLLSWLAGIPTQAWADSGRIIKVLAHRVDKEGRHALHPSLYERDAYQAHLRRFPAECRGLQFDVQWKARVPASTPLTLRMELLSEKGPKGVPRVIETEVKAKTHWSRWAKLRLGNEEFQQSGEIIAWRATLWSGGQMLAEQKSFLW